MQTLLYFAAKIVVLTLQALPLTWGARLGRVGGALAHALDARHRRVAQENLRKCFPEFSDKEVKTIARENFRRIGECYVSAIKTSSMRFEKILARCEIVGLEKLNAEGAPSRVIAVGHFGNFEVNAFAVKCVKGYRPASTYRGLPQPGLDRLMREIRERSGVMLFERRGGLRDLTHAMSGKGVVLGLFCDQNGGPKGVWGKFLGVDCSTNPAPAVFALRYNAPLNTAICYRVGLARWRFEVGDEIPTHENGKARSIEEITYDVNRAFEAAIRHDPSNWFWVHRRWKPRGY